MAGPLSKIRVLDLSRILAGPWASQILADLGAEVIKVERPGQGDDTRTWGPPYLKHRDGNDTETSGYYLSCNRGKKSLTLDLSRPQGQKIARQLAAESDVVLENYRVGGLARYGLAYQDLEALNPRLIYCSITGFGQSGPYAMRPGYDFLIQAMGGLMSVTGHADGEPGGGPLRAGVAIADLMSGMYATVAVLAALNERERSGRGQHIDLALLDVQSAVLANQALNYFTGGTAPGRVGNTHPNVVPYQVFATADGHIIVAVGNDAQFARLCRVLGLEDLAVDQRFAKNAGRVRHRETLIPRLAEALTARPAAQWLEALEAVGVPAGPINTIDQVFADPQIRHRGMRIELPHAEAGSVALVGSPMNFSRTPVAYDLAPPGLGEHSDEVLGERLGLGPDEIAALREEGIV
ncbi:MAG: CaiB/BaiF CoA-transferase family protein [Alphaproteobacteria bacterium]